MTNDKTNVAYEIIDAEAKKNGKGGTSFEWSVEKVLGPQTSLFVIWSCIRIKGEVSRE